MKLLRWALIALVGLCFFSCEREMSYDVTFINRTSSEVTIHFPSDLDAEVLTANGGEKTLHRVCADKDGRAALTFPYEMAGNELFYPPEDTPDIYIKDGGSATVTIYDDYCDVR
jgi:hypothetical protein